MNLNSEYTRIIIALVANQSVLWGLKAWWPSIQKSKILLRLTAVVVCLVAVVLADWQPDGVLSADWVTTWLEAVAGAELSYQWLIKPFAGRS